MNGQESEKFYLGHTPKLAARPKETEAMTGFNPLSKNILITGRPRVGKSTLIKCCASWLGPRAGGFFTEEIQGEGVRGRSGFRLQTLEGQTGLLAEVDTSSPYRLGRYGIQKCWTA